MKKTIIVIMILIAFISICCYTQKPNDEVISISDEIYLVIEDSVFNEKVPVIKEDKVIYISFDIVKEKLDQALYYDSDDGMVIFTNRDRVIRYRVDDNKATVNNKDFYINTPIKIVDELPYIPDEILINNYDVHIDYIEDTNVVTVDRRNSNYIQGEVIIEGADIRINHDRKSPILLKDIPVETSVLVFEELKDWYKVRTYDGIVGYIEKKYIKVALSKDIYKVEAKPIEKNTEISEKINLTWDYTNKKSTDLDSIGHIYGINVVSPTWFSILDKEGNILDKGNIEYVKKYKLLGYEIWPLIDNGFNPDLTHEILSSSKSREEVIKKMVNIYEDYNADGINIDFENIYLKDKELLTQFVRELYPIFKEKKMTVSMDVTPLSTAENWSLCFDRKSLSEIVDYIMLMAYDQHWASSPVAGSVAEYRWVEESIINVLEEIPNEKLVLGIPFYTRLWKVEKTDDEEKVSSQALSMESANQFIEDNNITLEWNEQSGQYYGETIIDGVDYKIWIEDAKSLQLKSSLVNKYDLAGLASWRKGFETEEVWPAISNIIKLN